VDHKKLICRKPFCIGVGLPRVIPGLCLGRYIALLEAFIIHISWSPSILGSIEYVYSTVSGSYHNELKFTLFI